MKYWEGGKSMDETGRGIGRNIGEQRQPGSHWFRNKGGREEGDITLGMKVQLGEWSTSRSRGEWESVDEERSAGSKGSEAYDTQKGIECVATERYVMRRRIGDYTIDEEELTHPRSNPRALLRLLRWRDGMSVRRLYSIFQRRGEDNRSGCEGPRWNEHEKRVRIRIGVKRARKRIMYDGCGRKEKAEETNVPDEDKELNSPHCPHLRTPYPSRSLPPPFLVYILTPCQRLQPQ
jgi:hypothetical protein